MTLATNAFTSYSSIGNREDLSDIIYNVDPTDVPFMTGIPKTSAAAVLHEWQTDALAAAGENQKLEGDDTASDAATATTRLSNTCQINKKVPAVTGTQQAIVKAGRKDELAYQVLKRTMEIRRDMETSLLANTAEVTGDSTTARKLGGVPAWLATNVSSGTSGSVGGAGNTIYTDGTARAFTEALLKDVIKKCWDSGGDPDCIMVGSFNKQRLSAFTGNATRMKGAEDKKLVSSVDIYGSDFGDLEVIANRFQPADMAFVFQMDMFAVAELRPIKLETLSKTGDSERRHVVTEFTLESKNEKASGMVADLTVA
jgi:hypothetical protein